MFLLVSILFVLAHPKLRAFVVEKLQYLCKGTSGMLSSALDDFLNHYDKVMRKKELGDQALERICPAKLQPNAAVWRHAFMILYERKHALSVEEISSAILASGYLTSSRDFQKYVKQVLRSKDCFALGKESSWGLTSWYRNKDSTTA